MHIKDIINKIDELREQQIELVVENWILYPIKRKLRGEVRPLILRHLDDEIYVAPSRIRSIKLNKDGSQRKTKKPDSPETLLNKAAAAKRRVELNNGKFTKTYPD